MGGDSNMTVAILTDSTSDLSAARLEELGVTMIPLTITVGGEEYVDQIGLSSQEFYAKMEDAEELPKSSMPTPGAFIEAYEAALASGHDEVVAIFISSALSGTYEVARNAAEQVEGKIRVVDSLNTTMTLGLLVERACRKRDEGLDADAIADDIESVRTQATVFFTPLTLENLVKGGRASRLSAFAAHLINIKLIISVDDDGKAFMFKKVRGIKRAMKAIVESVHEAVEKNGKHTFSLLSVNNDEMVEDLKRMLIESGIEITDPELVNPGAVISTHVGLGAFGVAICPE